ncbi:hypothetical protein R3P38DRAFT_2782916 [Favolaschia claudopus]|uniref:Uncharacterized protein n=1 Tax=Favolaschia claudopus TaxID=2862362 RepID=A0AAW0B1V5_9AGAR
MSTLFERFREGSTSIRNRTTRVLAHLRYKTDFDWLRERTRKTEFFREAFMFIDLQSPPLPVVVERISTLPPFVRRDVHPLHVRLFGLLVAVIDSVDEETGRPLHIAVLKDPELNEAISAIYQNQVAVLCSIIRVDDETTVWTLASSDWTRDVGQVVELEVKLTRFEDDSSGNISAKVKFCLSSTYIVIVTLFTGLSGLGFIARRRIFTSCVTFYLLSIFITTFFAVTLLISSCLMPSRAILLQDAVRDPHHPILANDQVGVHYIVTRDKTMTDVCGSLERYSYKELFYPEVYERYLSPYRIRVPRYRPSFIGTVVGSELAYHDNPHMAETSGCYCNRIVLKCPVGADEATVQLFDKQVRVLEEIIEYDGQESPGKVLVNWTRTLKDGVKVIEVWTSLNDGGVHFDYPVGRDIELVVNLCKDEASDGSCPGNIAKCFTLWVRNHSYLSDADVGRT